MRSIKHVISLCLFSVAATCDAQDVTNWIVRMHRMYQTKGDSYPLDVGNNPVDVFYWSHVEYAHDHITIVTNGFGGPGSDVTMLSEANGDALEDITVNSYYPLSAAFSTNRNAMRMIIEFSGNKAADGTPFDLFHTNYFVYSQGPASWTPSDPGWFYVPNPGASTYSYSYAFGTTVDGGYDPYILENSHTLEPSAYFLNQGLRDIEMSIGINLYPFVPGMQNPFPRLAPVMAGQGWPCDTNMPLSFLTSQSVPAPLFSVMYLPSNQFDVLFSTNLTSWSSATNFVTDSYGLGDVTPTNFTANLGGLSCWRYYNTNLTHSSNYWDTSFGYLSLHFPSNSWSLVACPLVNDLDTNAAYNVTNLLATPGDGAKYAKWDVSGQAWTTNTYSASSHSWSGDGILHVGESILFINPNKLTNNFAGWVLNGTGTNVLQPGKFQMLSSIFPFGGRLTHDLGVPAEDGDECDLLINGSWITYNFICQSSGWVPSEPTLSIGQGFKYKKVSGGLSTNWVQVFGATNGTPYTTYGGFNYDLSGCAN